MSRSFVACANGHLAASFLSHVYCLDASASYPGWSQQKDPHAPRTPLINTPSTLLNVEYSFTLSFHYNFGLRRLLHSASRISTLLVNDLFPVLSMFPNHGKMFTLIISITSNSTPRCLCTLSLLHLSLQDTSHALGN